MKTIKNLIVSNDANIIEQLEQQIMALGHDLLTVSLHNQQTINAVQAYQPDLILLELAKKAALSIEITQQINQKYPTPLIYLSQLGQNKLRQKVRRIYPATYLIVPCHPEQLEACIEMALDRYSLPTPPVTKLKQGRLKLKEQGFIAKGNSFFTKDKGNRFVRVNIDEVLFIQAANSSVEINTLRKRYILSAGLRSFGQQFSHEYLMRVHRSYLVNMNQINAFEDNFLYVGADTIPIGKTYQAEVYRRLRRLRAD